MQSVGEAMAIGRTFKQAFVKAMRSRELDVHADAADGRRAARAPRDRRRTTATSCCSRRSGAGVDRGRDLHERTGIDPWFLAEIAALARGEDPEAGLVRTFKAVDTCAAEFEAETPYYYSGWERPGPTARATRCGAATRRAS